ncbi:hypothetical protein V1358_08070 [Pseudoalteromonas sp. YIC-656]|uniref:hypothetical protein n=1 Tax=Pseudoalteromonas pernae TaxID=3118054 RepID=UPI0032422551
MSNQKLTIVLGMHRSGTSLLSAGLSYIGANFGNELMGRTEFNLKGHWEDNDVVAFNNRVLTMLGLEWDSLDFIDDASWRREDIRCLINEGVQLIKNKLSQNAQQFAFKDPRTIRLLPIWLEIINRCDITPQFIIAFRNPLDVGVSLARRESKPLSLSQLLWMHHHFSYLDTLLSLKHDVAFVDFYDFCKQPKLVLSELADFLNLEKQDDTIVEFAEQFYDESLVTKQTDPYQLSENKRLYPFVFDAYRCLRLQQKSGTGEGLKLASDTGESWITVGPFLCHQYDVLKKENLANQQAVRQQEQEKQNELRKQLMVIQTKEETALELHNSIADMCTELAQNTERLNSMCGMNDKVHTSVTNLLEQGLATNTMLPELNAKLIQLVQSHEDNASATQAQIASNLGDVCESVRDSSKYVIETLSERVDELFKQNGEAAQQHNEVTHKELLSRFEILAKKYELSTDSAADLESAQRDIISLLEAQNTSSLLSEIKETLESNTIGEQVLTISTRLDELSAGVNNSNIDDLLGKYEAASAIQHSNLLKEYKQHLNILLGEVESSSRSMAEKQQRQGERLVLQQKLIQELQEEALKLKEETSEYRIVTQSLQRRLSDIHESLSWRITSPLRGLLRLFK